MSPRAGGRLTARASASLIVAEFARIPPRHPRNSGEFRYGGWACAGRDPSMAEPRPRLHWVETAGGPHLVLPEKYAAAWEGCFTPAGGRVVEATFRCDPAGPATG